MWDAPYLERAVQLTLLLWTGMVLFHYSACTDQPKRPQLKDVIIIGGGVAGSTVARELINDPEQRYNVVILEAREDRLGGRLWTDRSSPDALGADGDLGGALVDASDLHSPFRKLMDKLELTLKDAGLLDVRSPEGGTLHGVDEIHTLIQEHLIAKIRSAIRAKNVVNDFSAREAMDFVLMDEEMSQADQKMVELWDVVLATLIEPPFGTSLDNLSSSMFQVEKLSANHYIVEGMDELVNRLISGMEYEKPVEVELGQVVRQVKIDKNAQKVKVRTTQRKSYTADVVVVTVPLGVLKTGEVFFDPPLSKARQYAIKKVGFGKLNKVVLRFENLFWPENSGVFVPTPEVLKKSKPLIKTWINGYRLTTAAALIGMIPGDDANMMETMDDETLKQLAFKSLSAIFGEELIQKQKLTSIVRSSWSRDPFAHGSTSYNAVGNSPDERKELMKPICPYLYFAGEHATSVKPGCAEGAYLSGLVVADKIMNGCYENDDWKNQKAKKKEEL